MPSFFAVSGERKSLLSDFDGFLFPTRESIRLAQPGAMEQFTQSIGRLINGMLQERQGFSNTA
jgi:hypothetical protein